MNTDIKTWENVSETIKELRRYKQVLIDPNLLGNMWMENKIVRVRSGLPHDSRVVDTGYDTMRNLFYITFWSSEFDIVYEHEEIPIFEDIFVESTDGGY